MVKLGIRVNTVHTVALIQVTTNILIQCDIFKFKIVDNNFQILVSCDCGSFSEMAYIERTPPRH